jgi:5-methyltetrahydrofolate--homocysteine methyltransferase
MKTAVAHLEPHMEKVAGDASSRGCVVLATVKGDVHDIGKNLVDIILTNNGYKVHNLGIKVPIATILEKAEEVGADAVGMSGLLVKSTLVMRENLEEMNRRGLAGVPVLLGGAALTRSYVERDLRKVYEGKVFYGKDAFEGLRVLEQLGEARRSGVEDPELGRAPSGRKLPERKSERLARVDPATIPERSPIVETDSQVFTPPFVGVRVARGIAIDEIAAYLNETALFRNQWGFRPENGETDAEMKERVRALLRTELDEAKATGILVPQVAWGYLPANGDGDDLVIWKDEDAQVERVRFTFPRQRVEPYLCISDFFRPASSGVLDYAAFQVATMGREVSARTAELFAGNEYREYLFLHGLGVEMAEALAELWHHRIRSEWGFAGEDGPTLTGLFRQQYRGGRYSWGYPACPDLEDNAKVADLLEVSRIGVSVSEGFQMHPEQTTSAIICHHPRAKYFVA